jgi:hypothetical protein
MRKSLGRVIAFALLLQAAWFCAEREVRGQAPQQAGMAALGQYLIADEGSEIALARSAAPASISDGAEVMVLSHDGYRTVAQGSNGFVCVVERSWGAGTEHPEFWNPRVRAPICFNPPAARSFLRIYLMKTQLALAGKSKAEIVDATASAMDSHKVPLLEPGSMCYMMSKQQYLTDSGKNWHPHLMFFVPGDAAKTWGADLPGSPVMAADDPQERVTIMMVWVATWSDGTPGPPMTH